MFEYASESGQSLVNNVYNVTEAEINSLYELVKGQVPTGLSYTDTTTYLYYLGFKIQMAATFGLTTADIEIIL